MLKRGWLKKVLNDVARDVQTWPEWMRREAGIEEPRKSTSKGGEAVQFHQVNQNKGDVNNAGPWPDKGRKQMGLFQLGKFKLHSGQESEYKIDCDALTDGDMEAIAAMMVKQLRLKFGKVIGVPRGGLRIAKALEKYVAEGPTLIADDVLTTGKSMVELRNTLPEQEKRNAVGVVIFSRTRIGPVWIKPLFVISEGNQL